MKGLQQLNRRNANIMIKKYLNVSQYIKVHRFSAGATGFKPNHCASQFFRTKFFLHNPLPKTCAVLIENGIFSKSDLSFCVFYLFIKFPFLR